MLLDHLAGFTTVLCYGELIPAGFEDGHEAVREISVVVDDQDAPFDILAPWDCVSAYHPGAPRLFPDRPFDCTRWRR